MQGDKNTSIKEMLSEKAKKAQKRLKELEGLTSNASSKCDLIVDQYCKVVMDQAETGKETHFFDMKDYNQATITKVSMDMKTRLGDVLIIVSPRGIEANWRMSE
jgi:uncharacterized protein YbaP (TraB family)